MAVTEDAIDAIKEMIVSGELKPGDRLPVEKDLGPRLGLSRSSLREAIRALTTLRVLESRQGAGTFVTSLAPGLILEAVGFIVSFSDVESATGFLEVRRILESEAAARAATSMTDEELVAARALVDEMAAIADEPAPDVHRFLAVDRSFHSAISTASRNVALAGLADMLGGLTVPARSLSAAAEAVILPLAVEEHYGILDALEARDADRARLRAAAHVARLEDWYRSHVTEGEVG